MDAAARQPPRAADQIGHDLQVAALIVGGIGAIAITLLWAQLFPQLRRARSFEGPAPEPVAETAA